jgi:hypothetical protein
MNMRKLFAPLIIMLLALSSCDNNDLLQSEDKVNSQINGRWKKIWASSAEPYDEKWKFENGSLTITRETNDSTYVDHGQYSVTTKFSKCYISISGFTSEMLEFNDLNRKWTIADISGSVLYISTTNSGGAIISREFVKN